MRLARAAGPKMACANSVSRKCHRPGSKHSRAFAGDGGFVKGVVAAAAAARFPHISQVARVGRSPDKEGHFPLTKNAPLVHDLRRNNRCAAAPHPLSQKSYDRHDPPAGSGAPSVRRVVAATSSSPVVPVASSPRWMAGRRRCVGARNSAAGTRRALPPTRTSPLRFRRAMRGAGGGKGATVRAARPLPRR